MEVSAGKVSTALARGLITKPLDFRVGVGSAGILGNRGIPLGLVLLASCWTLGKELINLVWHVEVFFWVHAPFSLELRNVVNAKSRAVRGRLALVEGTNANNRVDVDEHGLLDVAGLADSVDNAVDVVGTVFNLEHCPVACLHFFVHVLGVGQINAAVKRDLVVIVQNDQVVQSQVAGQRDRLQSNTFLQTGVADNAVDGVVHHRDIGPVVQRGQVFGRNGQSNAVGNSLAQRPGGQLDSRVLDLGVAGTERVDPRGVVRLELLHSHVLVPGQVQEHVLEQTRVAVGQNNPVAVEEVGVVRRISHGVLPQSNTHGSHAHSAAGMAAAVLLDKVSNEASEGAQNKVV
ncbi:hypothetical protein OGAPHI_001379 [Ogataea philodendri]|uniref:Uncharacterized protein n=1 Tax=Ogataea philodendri TaxID=1378263 RepID=A0A9P8T7J7_9ASCO|nr:uncharacterized protein OGAPHI_001379 [Ogataea philodendri]KAH3669258.1 hypothetical protein OGAPHI_001379 [Ogataea philodendri]